MPPRSTKASIEASIGTPNDTSPSREKKPPSPDGLAFADWFRSTLPESIRLPANWRESFAGTFDELLRLDKRTTDEIRKVSEWARADAFWSTNFLSPAKLRKPNRDGIRYFDVFAEKMKAEDSKPVSAPHALRLGGRTAKIVSVVPNHHLGYRTSSRVNAADLPNLPEDDFNSQKDIPF